MPRPSIKTISTVEMSREDWLVQRKRGIGGSDAAAIVGLSHFSSPFSVWAEKTGRLPAKEETEAMRQGRDLEDYVAHRWMEATGKKVRRKNAILFNDGYPFALANIDREVVGEEAGLECKTTSALDLKQFRSGAYPPEYYVQCMHYMAVTGYQKWYLAVLVLGRGFYYFEIQRDEDEIAALMDAERRIWSYVEKDEVPPADGYEATTDAIETIYADGLSNTGSPVDLMGREGAIQLIKSISEQLSILGKKKEELEQVLKLDLGDMEFGRCGSFAVSWKTQERKTFDAKGYAAANPNLDLSQYYKTSKFRKFEIKEDKQNDGK